MLNLRSFLHELEAGGIDYLLLSGFSLTEGESVVDVDLCIHPGHKVAFLALVSELGFRPRRKPAELAGHVFFISVNPACRFYLDVQFGLFFVDIQAGEHIRLVRSLDEFLADRQAEGGVLLPDPTDCLILYAAKCAWQKKTLGKKQFSDLSKLTADVDLELLENRGLPDTLVDTLANKDIAKFIPAFRKLAPSIKQAIELPDSKEQGQRLYVLFLGPDGVGKTSIIDGVQKRLAIKARSLYLGIGREGWCSSVIEAFKGLAFGIGRKLRLDMFFWWCVFPLEVLLRRRSARAFGNWCVVLVDRFPGQPLLKGGLLSKLYKCLLPAPDLVIVLVGDPAQIAARKPDETTAERTVKEIRKWQAVAALFDAERLEIDTTKCSLQSSVDAVVSHLLKSDPFQRRFLL